MDIVKQCLHLYYGEKNKEENDEISTSTKLNKKRKVDTDCLDGDSKKIIIQKDHKPEVSRELEVSEECIIESSESEEEHVNEIAFEPPANHLSKNISEQEPGVSGESEISEGYSSQSTHSEEENANNITSKPSDNMLSKQISEQEEIDNTFIQFCKTKIEKNTLLNVYENNVNSKKNKSIKICDLNRLNGCENSHIEKFPMEGPNLAVKPKHLSSFFMKEHKSLNIAPCGETKNYDPHLVNSESAYNNNNNTSVTLAEPSDDVLIAPEQKSLSGDLTGISTPTLSQWSRGECITPPKEGVS